MKVGRLEERGHLGVGHALKLVGGVGVGPEEVGQGLAASQLPNWVEVAPVLKDLIRVWPVLLFQNADMADWPFLTVSPSSADCT